MRVNTINGRFNKLFLEMRKSLYVILGTLDLNLRLSGDHTQTCAWSIEEATVELLEDVWHFATIIIGDHSVIHT